MERYSESERNMMRQDAMRRAQEMRRGRQKSVQAPPRPNAGTKQPPKPDPCKQQAAAQTAHAPPPPPAAKPPQTGMGGLGGSLSGGLGALLGELDAEKLLILGVLYLLFKEGADLKLMGALAYVLL